MKASGTPVTDKAITWDTVRGTKRAISRCRPTDQQQDLRSRMAQVMIKSGIDIEVHHHEVATAGQAEFSMRFDTLTRMADKVLLYKYITKNFAIKNGYTATFMPKPLFQDNGSGMHVHQSIWKDGKNLFYDAKGYCPDQPSVPNITSAVFWRTLRLSWLSALPAPILTADWYPGYEAPINLVYSQRNRSACIRIPVYSTKP